MHVCPGDRVKLIACEVLTRECCLMAARSPWLVDVQFLPKGLHDLPRQEMLTRLQAAVDGAAAEGRYKAVLLGYARCNDGLVGLTARSAPLVIPKAHDCITLFFGSRGQFQGYFDSHPGTYYHTTGWCERNDPAVPGTQGIMARLGLDRSYAELVATYGRENADYILQTLGGGLEHYDRLCYIQMDAADEAAHIEASRQHARDQGWQFDLRRGDWSLFHKLLLGPWDEDMLIVPPGRRIIARNDSEVLGVDEGP